MEDPDKLCSPDSEALPNIPISRMKGEYLLRADKVDSFFKALKSVTESWAKTYISMANFRHDSSVNMEQLVDSVLATLDCVMKAAAELLDVLESSSELALPPNTIPAPFRKDPGTPPPPLRSSEVLAPSTAPLRKVPPPPNESNPTAMPSKGPTPTAIMPLGNVPGPPPRMPSKGSIPTPTPLGKGPGPPPPPPPAIPSKGSIPTPTPLGKGPGLPPPPPPAIPSKGSIPAPMPPGNPLLQKRATPKLKRSLQMPKLLRELKGKMEGSGQTVKSTRVRKLQLGGSNDGKAGLAAALAELSKRSPYFQQVEEDVQKYTKPILELKVSINCFQPNDMETLLKFQNKAESLLGLLTDESQMLARVEGFPTKKLETLRGAAAQYSKLNSILMALKNWEIVPPLGKLLVMIESYFAKIKLVLDAFERNKEEESKNFKAHNINFDFHIVTRIKEVMVDLSSSCMELALQERRESRSTAEKGIEETTGAGKTDQKQRESMKKLWTVFQFAFRVYTFAGGLDDRAEKLAKELAHEILST